MIRDIVHLNLNVTDINRSIAFYEDLGFKLIVDTGFEQGHPIMMDHPSGVVLNLLGPSSEAKDENILMDVAPRYAGYTHMALRVGSLSDARAFFEGEGIEITGSFTWSK